MADPAVVAENGSTASASAITLSGTATAGRRLLVCARWRNTSATAGISGGPTFTQQGAYYDNAAIGPDRLAWFSAQTGAGGGFSISIDLSAAATYRYAAVIECDDDGQAAQAVAMNFGNPWASNIPTSGNMTPTDQPNWFIGVSMTQFNTTAISADAAAGYTDLGVLSVWNAANSDTSRVEFKATTSTSADATTFTLAGADGGYVWGIVVGQPATVVVSSVTPDTFADAETGIVIAGAEFLASQGDGRVVISPVDNINGETSVGVTRFGGGTGGTNPTTGTTLTIPASLKPNSRVWVAFTSRDHTSGTAQPTVVDNNGGAAWTQEQFSTDRKAQLWSKPYESGLSGKTITIAGCVGSCSAVQAVLDDVYQSAGYLTNYALQTNASGTESHAAVTPANAGSAVLLAVFNYANDNAVSSVTAATTGAPGNTTGHLSTGGSDCGTSLSVWNNHPASSSGSLSWAQTNGTTYSMAFAVRPRTPAGAAVEQAVTAWADDEITFTADQDTLPAGTDLYLFVENDDGASNAAGFVVQFEAGGTPIEIDGTVDALTISEQAATVRLARNVVGGVDALVITERTAMVGVARVIAAAADALILAEQPAGVTLSRAVLAGLDTLTIAEQPAVVRVLREIAAGFDALAISEQPAAVTLARHVQAGFDALVLTELQASVSAGASIAAGFDALTIAELQASVALAQTVLAGYDELAITEQPAAVAVSRHVQAAVDALVIAEFAATVSAAKAIAAGLDTLTLTEHPASISVGMAISAGLDALTIDPKQAAVALARHVAANLDALLLAEQPAQVRLAKAVAAGTDALAISEQAATIELVKGVLAGLDALVLTENPALVGLARDIAAAFDALLISESPAQVDLINEIRAGFDALVISEKQATIDTVFAQVIEKVLQFIARAPRSHFKAEAPKENFTLH